MATEEYLGEANSFEVIGGNHIGEKAEFLRDLTAPLNEAGFDVPPTVVLADELLAPTRDTLAAGVVDKVDETSARTIGLFVKRALAPIVVSRSSALADGRGTGVYESIVSLNKWAGISRAVLGVISSYHSEGAKAFREQLGLDDEFGVILQPVVGQIEDPSAWHALYNPSLSGTAYTSTTRESGGVIKFIPGFGGGVQDRGALQITEETIERLTGSSDWDDTEEDQRKLIPSLAMILRRLQRDEMVSGRTGKRSPFWTDLEGIYAGGRGKEFYLNRKQGGFEQFDNGSLAYRIDEWEHTDKGYIDTSQRPISTLTNYGNALNAVRPGQILEQLAKLEEIVGTPVYLEWALTMDDEQTPHLWAVQATPVETRPVPPTESVDFSEVYYQARGVIGESGIRKATKVVVADNPGAVEHLHEFNADPENEGYILIYTSRLTTSISRGGDYRMLSWGDCYRAGVILEMQDARHSGSPIEHIQGVAKVTGKLFGVIDWHASGYGEKSVKLGPRMQEWQSEDVTNVPDWASISVYEGNVTVAADIQGDALVVGLQKD